MVTKQDCLLLLSELQVKGFDCKEQINTLVLQKVPSVEIIKFIYDNMDIDLINFYEKLRKSYNNKKSKLYINIVKEISDPSEMLTTLSAMLTQILLFAKSASNSQMFLRQARAEDIATVLENYFQTYNLTNSLNLLRLIKADLCVCEYITGRRK